MQPDRNPALDSCVSPKRARWPPAAGWPDQWSSVPLLQFERRDDPSWPQADDDSSGSRVALAELVSVQQLLVILGYGGPTLTSPAARRAIPAVIARSSPAGAGHR